MSTILLSAFIFIPFLVSPAAAALTARRGARTGLRLAIGAALLECLLMSGVWLLPDGAGLTIPGVCGLGLHFRLDGFRRLYTAICVFMWTVTLLFSPEYFAGHARHMGRYLFSLLMTLGATIAVFLSADLFTLLIFFEIMSFTSYEWVVHDETPEAKAAAKTYLAVAVIGGFAALMGLFLLWHLTGTMEIAALPAAAANVADRRLLYTAGGCLLFGFGAKAGMYPLHFWLPKAHPVAPAPASALLSGILTKTGIFGILCLSCHLFADDAAWGTVILVLGTITMVWGAVLALASVNLKRTLACSSLSQIGFILVGVSMVSLLGSHHNALAARGVLLHMVNHSLFKLLLFMLAGVVALCTHKLELNDIRGFGRGKPLFRALFLIGALGLGGVPLLSGYVSKTLLHESIVEYIAHLHELGQGAALFTLVEWLFLLSGGLTLAYMAKLYVCLFVDKPVPSAAVPWAPRPATVAVFCLAAALIPLGGLLPGLVMGGTADLGVGFISHAEAPAVHYFAWVNLKGALISVLIGAAVYFLVVRRLLMRPGETGELVYVGTLPNRGEARVRRPASTPLGVPGGVMRRLALFSDSFFVRLGSALGAAMRRLAQWSDSFFILLGNTLGTAMRHVASSSDAGASALVRGVSAGARAVCRLPDRLVSRFRYTVISAVDTTPDRIGEEHPALRAALRMDRVHVKVRGREKEESYTVSFRRAMERSEKRRHLSNSPSYALLMVCLGLTGMMLYLLFS